MCDEAFRDPVFGLLVSSLVPQVALSHSPCLCLPYPPISTLPGDSVLYPKLPVSSASLHLRVTGAAAAHPRLEMAAALVSTAKRCSVFSQTVRVCSKSCSGSSSGDSYCRVTNGRVIRRAWCRMVPPVSVTAPECGYWCVGGYPLSGAVWYPEPGYSCWN